MRRTQAAESFSVAGCTGTTAPQEPSSPEPMTSMKGLVMRL